MNRVHTPSSRGVTLWEALTACPTLAQASPERDSLWLEVRTVVCTHTSVEVRPFGSAAQFHVTEDHASDELIAAMSWLYAHELLARSLGSHQLYCIMRGIATRSAAGSARAAQSDSLHGMSAVPPGAGLRWTMIDRDGAP